MDVHRIARFVWVLSMRSAASDQQRARWSRWTSSLRRGRSQHGAVKHWSAAVLLCVVFAANHLLMQAVIRTVLQTHRRRTAGPGQVSEQINVEAGRTGPESGSVVVCLEAAVCLS